MKCRLTKKLRRNRNSKCLGVTSSCQLSAANLKPEKHFLIYFTTIVVAAMDPTENALCVC